jgi:hypothetical protein
LNEKQHAATAHLLFASIETSQIWIANGQKPRRAVHTPAESILLAPRTGREDRGRRGYFLVSSSTADDRFDFKAWQSKASSLSMGNGANQQTKNVFC